MKVTDATLHATLAILVLMAAHAYGAPASEPHSFSNEPDSEVVARWIINQLTNTRRDRRTQMDGGFLSRHSALQNFLNSYDAGIDAADPNGPGRRK